jgi:predicted SAM-dependent methyltransferase
LAKKIPLRSNYADYAYSSHLLEHLFWYQGLKFLKEIFRILKKNGKIRILVPDFKKIFKQYIDGNKDYFKEIKKNLNEKDYLYYKNLLRKPRNQISTSSFRNSSSTPTSWHNSVKKINILH